MIGYCFALLTIGFGLLLGFSALGWIVIPMGIVGGIGWMSLLSFILFLLSIVNEKEKA